jgi:hypothetical protein
MCIVRSSCACILVLSRALSTSFVRGDAWRLALQVLGRVVSVVYIEILEACLWHGFAGLLFSPLIARAMMLGKSDQRAQTLVL